MRQRELRGRPSFSTACKRDCPSKCASSTGVCSSRSRRMDFRRPVQVRTAARPSSFRRILTSNRPSSRERMPKTRPRACTPTTWDRRANSETRPRGYSRHHKFKLPPPANVVLVVLKAHSVECEEKADSFFAVGLKQINSDSTDLLSFGPLPLPPSRQPIGELRGM